MKISYLAGMDVSASGLTAQRAVMNAVSENLANAQTTKTETGEPYRRKIPSLASSDVPFAARLAAGKVERNLTRTDPAHMEPEPLPARLDERTAIGVSASVSDDPSDFPTIFDPSHPDADEKGMVRMPNVETAREMVTLLAASRAYESNVAALQAARRLAEASLNLAR
jgi:flagellar basal-body rod protein FlgC